MVKHIQCWRLTDQNWSVRAKPILQLDIKCSMDQGKYTYFTGSIEIIDADVDIIDVMSFSIEVLCTRLNTQMQ